MKRRSVSILLLVVMIFTHTYAVAEDLDLTQMSTRELENLRKRINLELKSRPEEVESPDERTRRREIEKQIESWSKSYDFMSIIQYVSSEDCGLSEACRNDIGKLATEAFQKSILCVEEVDEFSGEKKILPDYSVKFGEIGQVYPYIDKSGFHILVGFPYDLSFLYTSVFLKDEEGNITEMYMFDRDNEFSIELERINDKLWEYSILNNPYPETLVAISFRDKDSITKVDYQLLNQEKQSYARLKAIYNYRKEIDSRMTSWELLGE